MIYYLHTAKLSSKKGTYTLSPQEIERHTYTCQICKSCGKLERKRHWTSHYKVLYVFRELDPAVHCYCYWKTAPCISQIGGLLSSRRVSRKQWVLVALCPNNKYWMTSDSPWRCFQRLIGAFFYLTAPWEGNDRCRIGKITISVICFEHRARRCGGQTKRLSHNIVASRCDTYMS